MSKFEPLWKYVCENDISEMFFKQIKDILGFDINHSFLTYKKELKEYGYEVKKISMKDKTVKFGKVS